MLYRFRTNISPDGRLGSTAVKDLQIDRDPSLRRVTLAMSYPTTLKALPFFGTNHFSDPAYNDSKKEKCWSAVPPVPSIY